MPDPTPEPCSPPNDNIVTPPEMCDPIPSGTPEEVAAWKAAHPDQATGRPLNAE